MSRQYPAADVKTLYAKAAGRCSIENCRIDLTLPTSKNDKTKQIGKIAHIIAHSSKGPRGNEHYPRKEIDIYNNWILLCPTCHDTIDALVDQYPSCDLLKIKTSHETWVNDQLKMGMLEVTFAELEIAAKAVATGQYLNDKNFYVIPPEEKIEKNRLTLEIRALLSMGLSRSSEVTNYLLKASELDCNFTKRLQNGFKTKYLELSKTLSGDELFIEMSEFAQNGQRDFVIKAASLAILSHLFHLCEIFEI